MTQKELNTAGFIVNERSIESITYREYLNEYGQDLCTSPRGVCDRMHIREVEGEDGIEYQVWTWGVNGNNPRYEGTSFDNEEDAELYYYERSEWYVSEKNWNAPRFHSSYDDAIEDMAAGLERSEDVIRRYIALSVITARKAAEHRAIITKENDERKAKLAIEVPKEAHSLVIDEEFKAAVRWADAATGNEKSQRMASAMKGLLARNGKEKIESDFWQVARILKAKVK